MSYYKDQQKVNVFLSEKFNALVKGEFTKLEVNALVLHLTEEFAIPEKYVRKRVDLLLSIYPGVELRDGVLIKND